MDASEAAHAKVEFPLSKFDGFKARRYKGDWGLGLVWLGYGGPRWACRARSWAGAEVGCLESAGGVHRGGGVRWRMLIGKLVSKSNPFEVLTSIDNDMDLGTNGGISNSADKGTFNVSSSNTPIGEKIDKIKRQICEGKLRFVDDDRNPLVPTSIGDSDREVEVVFDETANLRISTSGKEGSDKGYGTNSLFEQ
ncbi:hypothetical protein Tco_0132532 [Tanacetum coccineum]